MLLLSSVWLSGLFGGGHFHQLIPQGLGFAVQIFQHSLPVVLLIIILADIDVVSAVLEHTVDEPSQFVGGGRGRFGSPETGLLAPKISAQGTVAVMKSAGGQAQRLGRAVSAGLGFATEQFAAGFFRPRAQAQPGSEVFTAWPAAHVQANLGNHHQTRIGADPINAGQIHPRDPVQFGAQVQRRLVALGFMPSPGRG
jgi:hypothetical protein